MITDNVKNINLYRGISASMDLVLDSMVELTPEADLGRVSLVGEDVFYSVLQYEATPADATKKYEAHQRYVDVQYILSGTETIVYQRCERLTTDEPYSESKDIGFYVGNGYAITLSPGDFMVLFPEDAHMPGIGNGQVKKVVFKIKIN